MTTDDQTPAQRAQDILRRVIPADATIYGTRTANRTGTCNRVRLFLADGGRITEWTTTVSVALDAVDLRGREAGIRVKGGGTCPVLHLVQRIARVVFNDACDLKAVKL